MELSIIGRGKVKDIIACQIRVVISCPPLAHRQVVISTQGSEWQLAARGSELAWVQVVFSKL